MSRNNESKQLPLSPILKNYNIKVNNSYENQHFQNSNSAFKNYSKYKHKSKRNSLKIIEIKKLNKTDLITFNIELSKDNALVDKFFSCIRNKYKMKKLSVMM